MATIVRWIAAGALLCTLPMFAAAAVSGPVTVEFVQPEKFSDVKDRLTRTAPEKNPNLHNLRKHTEMRAARYLQGGQTLLIQFTDIDLAGDHLPQLDPALFDVRVVTGLYPPRFKLNYSLRDADGTVIKSGQADLRDIGFDSSSPGNTSDPLRYEKRLLNKWLRKEFGS